MRKARFAEGGLLPQIQLARTAETVFRAMRASEFSIGGYSALKWLQTRMAARPTAKQRIAPMPMLLHPGNTAGIEPTTKPRMAE